VHPVQALDLIPGCFCKGSEAGVEAIFGSC